jgi:hypothetical protein
VRLVLLVALVVVVPTAHATHPAHESVQPANLDLDAAVEQVVAAHGASSDHSVWNASIRIRDRCKGRTRSYVVVDGYALLWQWNVVQADGRGPNELLAVIRSPLGDAGEARVVRLRSRTRRCGVLHTLFRYVAGRARSPAPDLVLKDIYVLIEDGDKRWPGRELVLWERFRHEWTTSVIRVTYHRYDRPRDRYVAYETSTIDASPPPAPSERP